MGSIKRAKGLFGKRAKGLFGKRAKGLFGIKMVEAKSKIIYYAV